MVGGLNLLLVQSFTLVVYVYIFTVVFVPWMHTVCIVVMRYTVCTSEHPQTVSHMHALRKKGETNIFIKEC